MCFPIQFSRPSSPMDIFSPVINFTGNSAVVAVGGLAVASITYAALKALGYSNRALTIPTAIPISISALGAIGTAIGLAAFTFIYVQTIQRFRYA